MTIHRCDHSTLLPQTLELKSYSCLGLPSSWEHRLMPPYAVKMSRFFCFVFSIRFLGLNGSMHFFVCFVETVSHYVGQVGL